VVRDGTSPVDDDVYSSAHRLASLEDGTYVDGLRDPTTPYPADHQSQGDGAIGANMFGARTPQPETTPPITVHDGDDVGLEFLPPPTGPPVIAAETIGRPAQRIRPRRGHRRTSAEATD
jgi:hypothetical protein